MPNIAALIEENLARVKQQIADAAAASGRDASDVQLVGVTKYVDARMAEMLFVAGCRDFGESRPQQLCDKAEALAELSIEWHMVGNLQRNKVRRVLPVVSLIHSGDSLKLLKEVDRAAEQLELARVRMLIEVNISGEDAKHGFASEEVQPALDEMSRLTHVEIVGLMCMASLDGDSDAARREFAELRELRDRLLPNCPESISLAELSMGMSGDFSEAIREGATIVRVGSALFEGCP